LGVCPGGVGGKTLFGQKYGKLGCFWCKYLKINHLQLLAAEVGQKIQKSDALALQSADQFSGFWGAPN